MDGGSPDVLLNEFPFRELTLGEARHNTLGLWFIFSVYLLTVCHWKASGQSQYQSSTDFATRSKEGREPNEEALVERLRQFVENSDLSFYQIASRIGTSGGTLSMWLAGKARPHAEELAAIEKFLKG